MTEHNYPQSVSLLFYVYWNNGVLKKKAISIWSQYLNLFFIFLNK